MGNVCLAMQKQVENSVYIHDTNWNVRLFKFTACETIGDLKKKINKMGNVPNKYSLWKVNQRNGQRIGKLRDTTIISSVLFATSLASKNTFVLQMAEEK